MREVPAREGGMVKLAWIYPSVWAMFAASRDGRLHLSQEDKSELARQMAAMRKHHACKGGRPRTVPHAAGYCRCASCRLARCERDRLPRRTPSLA